LFHSHARVGAVMAAMRAAAAMRRAIIFGLPGLVREASRPSPRAASHGPMTASASSRLLGFSLPDALTLQVQTLMGRALRAETPRQAHRGHWSSAPGARRIGSPAPRNSGGDLRIIYTII
jgi:hypothetical protein